jgi:hypothetical protein
LHPRMYRAARQGERDGGMTSGQDLVTRDRFGGVLLKEAPHQFLMGPTQQATGGIRSHTLYMGERVQPSWAHLQWVPKPTAQVKMYLKTTDQAGLPLARSEWRVRIEVALNGAALKDVLGVSTVGDLLTANFRALGKGYLRLAQASPVAGPKIPNRRRLPVIALLNKRLGDLAQEDARQAVKHGNFSRAEAGRIRLQSVPELTSLVTGALREFSRAILRAKKEGNLAPAALPDPSQAVDSYGIDGRDPAAPITTQSLSATALLISPKKTQKHRTQTTSIRSRTRSSRHSRRLASAPVKPTHSTTEPGQADTG